MCTLISKRLFSLSTSMPYLSSVPLTAFIPEQFGAMDDGSDDEELQLMTDVALLDAKLADAGRPFDETIFVHKFEGLHLKPLQKRLKLWRFRKQMREQLVASLPTRYASGAPADTPEHQPIRAPTANVEYDSRKAFKSSKPRFVYAPHGDGSPPEMSHLHVAFATKCADWLRENNQMTQTDLIQRWNRELPEDWADRFKVGGGERPAVQWTS